MSTLKETLDQMVADSAKRVPAEALEVFHRNTEKLIESGLHEKAVRTGDHFPDFDLLDANGNPARSAELIGNGPVIFNFFRGFW